MTRAQIKNRQREALAQAMVSDREEYLETLKREQDELYFLKADKERNILKIVNKQNKINTLKTKFNNYVR